MYKKRQGLAKCPKCRSIDSVYCELKKAIESKCTVRARHILECNFLIVEQRNVPQMIQRLFNDTHSFSKDQETIIGLFKLLFENGADVNSKDSKNQIELLTWAVKYRLTRVIDFLISCDVDLQNRDSSGNSILHFLITNEYHTLRAFWSENFTNENLIFESQSTDFIRWMLSKGLDVDCQNSRGITVLHLAAEYKLLHALPILLEHTKNVTIVDNLKMTAFQTFVALVRCCFDGIDCDERIYNNVPVRVTEIYRLFLEKGFSIDVVDNTGSTPLHYVLKHASCDHQFTLLDTAKLMLKRFINVNARDAFGNSVLHIIMDDFNKFSKVYCEQVSLLVSKGANVNYVNNYNMTPTLAAIENQSLFFLNLFINYGADLQYRYEDGNLLHYLMKSKQRTNNNSILEMIDLLVNGGCDLNEEDNEGKTPFHLAVQTNARIEVIEKLLEHGANVNVRDVDTGYTPLHDAVKCANKNVIKLILNKGANVNAKCNAGQTALRLLEISNVSELKKFIKSDGTTVNVIKMQDAMDRCEKIACSLSEVCDIARILVSHGADVTEPDNGGVSPLVATVVNLNETMLKVFIENKVDIRNGNLLHCLIERNVGVYCPSYKAVLDLLLEKGCDVNGPKLNGKTPLHVAVQFANVKIIKKLIKLGADVNRRNIKDGYTPVHEAVKCGREDSLDVLIENGADVNLKTNTGDTVLHLIKTPKIYIIKKLFKHGGKFDVNERGYDGYSMSHKVLNYFRNRQNIKEYCQIACYLVIKGANIEGDINDIPLPPAMKHFNLFLLKEMKKHENVLHRLMNSPCRSVLDDQSFNAVFNLLVSEWGCDVNEKDTMGKTPLHLAVQSANTEIIQNILSCGANIECKDTTKGYTPLHLAVHFGRKDLIMELLLQNGADVNARTKDNQTVLHLITKESQLDIVLEYGAYVNVRDSNGILPLHSAIQRCDDRIFKKLMISGAKLIDDVNKLYTSVYYTSAVPKKSWLVKFITEHLIALQVADMFLDQISKDYLKTVLNGAEIHHQKCLVEIERLKNYKISDSKCLYDLLHTNSYSMYSYVTNEKLEELINSSTLKYEFPMYYIIISLTYHMAVERRKIVEPAKQAWYELTGVNLPDLCLHEIFSYLSNSCLHSMIQAMKDKK